MRRHARAERPGRRGNLKHRRWPPTLITLGWATSIAPASNRAVEVVQSGGVLAGGDRHAALATDARPAHMIAGRRDRFLQPGQVELAHPPRQPAVFLNSSLLLATVWAIPSTGQPGGTASQEE